MRIGMTMPVMEANLDRVILRQWARAIDEGPFNSLCWGERIAFNNPDCLTLLGALAAWTDRVQLKTTVVVPQLHEPVMLAKALATGDVLSGGRLTVGVGVGGRREDYRAVSADPSTHAIQEMTDRVATMKRVWAGEHFTDTVLPIGPLSLQPGGPRLLVGTLGRRTLRSCAAWADGLAGVSLYLNIEEQNALFEVGRRAWAQVGKPAPDLTTSFWFAIGDPDSARMHIHRHLRHYMNWISVGLADAMAAHTGFAGTEEQLAEVLRGFAAIGTSEVHLIPTSSDISQLERAADVAVDLTSSTG